MHSAPLQIVVSDVVLFSPLRVTGNADSRCPKCIITYEVHFYSIPLYFTVFMQRKDDLRTHRRSSASSLLLIVSHVFLKVMFLIFTCCKDETFLIRMKTLLRLVHSVIKNESLAPRIMCIPGME